MPLEIAMVADRDTDDRPLILKIRDGDRAAFGALVERYMRRAYYAALGLVGSHDDALDLSQEAFVRAFRAREKLDPERPFYPWLYQILRRLCFNFTRDRRTRTARLEEASWGMAEGARARAQVDDPVRRLERRELRERLDAAIDTLPDRLREVFVLREFEQLKYREIAELLDIPIGTVMSRLYDARRALAAQLGDIR